MNDRRTRSVSSPESIAAALVGLLAVVLIGSQALAGKVEPTTPVESSSPSAVAVTSPTMNPDMRTALATALVVNQSLASRVDPLQEAIQSKKPVAAGIAEHLRLVNSDLNAGDEAAVRLQIFPESKQLGLDLAKFYNDTLDRNAKTLGTLIESTGTYVEGGRAIIELLAALPAFNTRITDMLSGRSNASASPSTAPTPSASSSPPPPPSPSPSPSPTLPPSAPPASGSIAPSVAPSLSAADSMLANAGFEDGVNHWRLQLTDGAEATLTAESKAGPDGSVAARVDISVGSAARAGISLMPDPISLRQGATYTIALAVKATEGREVRVSLTDSAGQTTNARVFPVNPGWQVITFDAKQLVADSSVQLGLDLGRSDATVWFDNVVVREAPG